MAQYNEILEGGLNQVIVKRLGMQTGTAVPAVQPEMTMDLTLESDRIEWGFLKGEYRYTYGQSLAAPAAGSVCGLAIENNGNSGLIVVVESFLSSVAVRWAIASTVSGFVAGVRGYSRDTRQATRGLFCNEYVTTTGNLPALQGYLPANEPANFELVVAPNNYFVIHASQAATAAVITMQWRERPVLPSELG